jgi:hypothetical protein
MADLVKENHKMDCPCCSDRLIRHIKNQQMYWFCRTCWERILPFDVEQQPSPVEQPSLTAHLELANSTRSHAPAAHLSPAHLSSVHSDGHRRTLKQSAIGIEDVVKSA